MATTEYHKIPQTILSRTQHFHFANVSAKVITKNLTTICKAEGVKISDRSLAMLARAAEGSVRDAQSLLDQVISFSGLQVKDEDVETIVGSISRDLVEKVVKSIGEGNSAGLINLVAEISDKGYDLVLLIRELMKWFRLLLFVKVEKGNKLTSLIESEGFNRKEMTELAGVFEETRLLVVFDLLAHAENRMKNSTFPRFVLEVALVKAAESKNLLDIEAVLSIAEGSAGNYRDRSGTGNPDSESQSYSTESAESQSIRITGLLPYHSMNEREARSLRDNEVVAESEKGIAGKFLDIIGKRSKGLWSILKKSEKISMEGDQLVIYLSHRAGSFTKQMLERKENEALIGSVLEEILGKDSGYVIKEYMPSDLEEAPTVSKSTEELKKQREMEEVLKEPMVQEVLNRFHGEITDIKKNRN